MAARNPATIADFGDEQSVAVDHRSVPR